MAHEAIELALERHGKRVLHLAYSYLHSREEAEDVLQDVMVKYLQSAPDFASDEHEKAWLLRVTINLCKNHLKAPWRRLKADMPEDISTEDKTSEDTFALRQAVLDLPPKYRAVIHLFYYEDLPASQIASILGQKETTVRSLLFRARNILREKLGEEVAL